MRRIIHTIPTLFIDHHHPTGQPPEAITLTGYNWNPIPTSSLLTYLLCNSDDTPSDIAWKAAIGNIGDLGPEHPSLTQAAKAQKLKWIREATTILNAAKRSRLYPQAEAFRALLTAPSAQQIAEDTTADLTLLKACRTEVKDALNEAKRLAPKFSKTEQVALLEFSDPNRIHPLLAQSWHGRLPKFIVFAANHGWLPNKVAFSARTSSAANIHDLLQKYRHVIPDELEYGYGHDQAAGGVISEEGWQKLKAAMSLP
ncbi:MAG: DHH family phosphoesterase [Chloroflexia bacterium]